MKYGKFRLNVYVVVFLVVSLILIKVSLSAFEFFVFTFEICVNPILVSRFEMRGSFAIFCANLPAFPEITPLFNLNSAEDLPKVEGQITGG